MADAGSSSSPLKSVKQEPIDATELEDRILILCAEIPKGINDTVIQNDMPQFSPQQRVMAINRLLSMSKIDLLKSGNELVYKLKDPEGNKSRGADNQEKLIYKIIEAAGNKGIWIRDIRYESNLLLTQVNKILKNLESKKLIKSVKSVAAAKKKVYMLFNLEPDRSVTGGAWYSDQDFESEFVEVLNQQCLKYLESKRQSATDIQDDPIAQRNASYSSSFDIWNYINELGISKIKLGQEDVEMILDTLIYDGKVEKSVVAAADGEDTKLYRAVKSLIPTSGMVRMPCGVCPLIYECKEGAMVSPATCIYMAEWLNQS